MRTVTIEQVVLTETKNGVRVPFMTVENVDVEEYENMDEFLNEAGNSKRALAALNKIRRSRMISRAFGKIRSKNAKGKEITDEDLEFARVRAKNGNPFASGREDSARNAILAARYAELTALLQSGKMDEAVRFIQQ